MMWQEPQNCGVEETWTMKMTAMRNSPSPTPIVSDAMRTPRGVRRPRLRRVSQRSRGDPGPMPNQGAIESSPAGGGPAPDPLESAQHEDGDGEVEPEHDEQQPARAAVPELGVDLGFDL